MARQSLAAFPRPQSGGPGPPQYKLSGAWEFYRSPSVMTCVMTFHLASPGAGINVTLELRGAGEEDRGSQKASLLLWACLSRWLEAACGPVPTLSVQPTWTSSHHGYPSVYLLLLRVRRLRGPGVEPCHPDCHLGCIATSVVNYTLMSSNLHHLGSSFQV